MAIEFVLCRRKDDHTVTHMIARQSLRHWPDWEPIPDAEQPARLAQAGSGATPAQPAPETGTDVVAEPAPPTTASKRRAAATDNKE